MDIFGKIQLLALLAVRGLFIRPGPPLTLDQRLAAMPCHDLPLNRPASIRWNTHQVPYIESEDDEDLAFCFGLVHAHLRLGQIELLRRAACGRLAELGGTGLVAIGSARTGSNAFALSGGLTSTGKPILAADPHLALSLPNTWILAGARSPGFHAVGLMLPGLPFIASGRNPWIAWGGTSLHAATSDL